MLDIAAEACPVRPEGLNEVAPGIYYTSREFVLIDPVVVAFLKQAARTNAARRARVCAHPSADADQHDMLIASHRDTYVAPHRHLSKSESFLVVEGIATVLLFSDDGSKIERIAMGPAGSGRPFFYRMPACRYHTLCIESEVLVFTEATKGPFVKSDMEHAPWAPPGDDVQRGCAYIESCARPT